MKLDLPVLRERPVINRLSPVLHMPACVLKSVENILVTQSCVAEILSLRCWDGHVYHYVLLYRWYHGIVQVVLMHVREVHFPCALQIHVVSQRLHLLLADSEMDLLNRLPALSNLAAC